MDCRVQVSELVAVRLLEQMFLILLWLFFGLSLRCDVWLGGGGVTLEFRFYFWLNGHNFIVGCVRDDIWIQFYYVRCLLRRGTWQKPMIPACMWTYLFLINCILEFIHMFGSDDLWLKLFTLSQHHYQLNTKGLLQNICISYIFTYRWRIRFNSFNWVHRFRCHVHDYYIRCGGRHSYLARDDNPRTDLQYSRLSNYITASDLQRYNELKTRMNPDMDPRIFHYYMLNWLDIRR